MDTDGSRGDVAVNSELVQPGRRARLRAEAIAALKAAAKCELIAVGAHQLSLRSVAAAAGMSSPGVYRYFPSRDALLTEMITDIYDELTTSLEAARHNEPDPDPAALWIAVSLAYFDWAHLHRAEFSLVFGSPVPGYSAPPGGATVAAAARFAAVWEQLLQQLHSRPEPFDVPNFVRTQQHSATKHPTSTESAAAFLAMACQTWAQLHGIIVLGLYGHLYPNRLSTSNIRAIYQDTIQSQLRNFRTDLSG